jgi:Domain of unknown function (DUF4365)
MITEQHRKEFLSEAYVRAVAAHAGIIIATDQKDYGLDGTFKPVTYNPERGRYLPNGTPLDYQIKATSNHLIEDENIVYDLEAKTYNDFISWRENKSTPTILLIFVMEDDLNYCLQITEEELLIRRCCYYYIITGPTTNNQNTIRIRIPRNQIFDSNALTHLLNLADTGELQ